MNTGFRTPAPGGAWPGPRAVPDGAMRFYSGPYAGGWLVLAWALLAVGAWALFVGVIWLAGLMVGRI